MSKIAECPVCGADVELADDAVQGELITCPECGVELEIACCIQRPVIGYPELGHGCVIILGKFYCPHNTVVAHIPGVCTVYTVVNGKADTVCVCDVDPLGILNSYAKG